MGFDAKTHNHDHFIFANDVKKFLIQPPLFGNPFWSVAFILGCMEVLRFDFNGSSGEFKRTPQGFLRVNARLSKTGVFSYQDQCEFRSDEEVFRADSLESLKGAPVTDLHPAEKGGDNFLTPANAKNHIIGITEGVERDGAYIKGSLIIFH